jgi:hypothetical protein
MEERLEDEENRVYIGRKKNVIVVSSVISLNIPQNLLLFRENYNFQYKY